MENRAVISNVLCFNCCSLGTLSFGETAHGGSELIVLEENVKAMSLSTHLYRNSQDGAGV